MILDKNPLQKHRTNLSKVSYNIDSRVGNQFIIKADDGSIDTVPGYKIVHSDKRVPLAESIKNGKRGIIKEIVYYHPQTNRYDVMYDTGERDEIAAINLREGNPTKLSRMEREFWIKQKSIPVSIRRYV